MKSLNVPRYKIVSIVTVGSKSGQTYLQASQCLLSKDFDEVMSETFENGSVFVNGIVYTLYHE